MRTITATQTANRFSGQSQRLNGLSSKGIVRTVDSRSWHLYEGHASGTITHAKATKRRAATSPVTGTTLRSACSSVPGVRPAPRPMRPNVSLTSARIG
jgi:hypothetical protein